MSALPGVPRLTLPAETGDWTEQAACKGENPDRFYPIPYGRDNDAKAEYAADVEQTKQICRACPVYAECWDYAVPGERWGIWAATTEEERHTMRRREQRRASMARTRAQAREAS